MTLVNANLAVTVERCAHGTVTDAQPSLLQTSAHHPRPDEVTIGLTLAVSYRVLNL